MTSNVIPRVPRHGNRGRAALPMARPQRWPVLCVALLAAILTLGCGDNHRAKGSDAAGSGVDAPPRPPSAETFVSPPELVPTSNLPDGTIAFEIAIEPVEITLATKTGEQNRHCLRQYVDANSTEPKTSLPGPTMRIPRGPAGTSRSVRLNLENRFDDVDLKPIHDIAVDVNTTNFHVHGLHVSPNDTAYSNITPVYWADNVLMSNCPRNCYSANPPPGCGACSGHTPAAPGAPNDPWQYRFDIDYDRRHEPGTFWYHPHIHGSTALQVANGMAGMLIIEDRLDDDLCATVFGAEDPKCDSTAEGGRPFERLLVMQTVRAQDPGLRAGVVCDQKNLTIDDPNLDFFGSDTATPMFINGVYQPNIVMTANTPERWRVLHATTSPNLTMSIGKVGSSGSCDALSDDRQILYRMAADGLPFDRLYNTQQLVFEPGYRYDLLLELPDPGRYCVWDVAEDDMQASVKNVVATIDVVPGRGESLLAGAYENINTLLRDYRCGGQAPQPDCSDLEPERVITFRQGNSTDIGPYCGEPGLAGNSLNGLRFNHPIVDWCLPRDTSETWRLQATSGGHPFHIHINPFSVCRIVDNIDPAMANDTGELCSGCTDTCGDCDCGPCDFSTAECPLRPYLRDTLVTRTNMVSTIRHFFETYTGGFVQHCHILPHEDGGMMQHLQIMDTCSPDDQRTCCSNDLEPYQICDDPAQQCRMGTEACSADRECCSGTCNPTGQCCSYGGDTCTQDSDCCSPLQKCVDSGGNFQCTSFTGAPCTDNAQCVSAACNLDTNTCY